MLKIFNYNKKSSSNSLKNFLGKRKLTHKNLALSVSKIIKNVKNGGDQTVINYEKKYSKIKTKSNRVFFSNKELNLILKKTDKKLKAAIDLAFVRIKKFHLKILYILKDSIYAISMKLMQMKNIYLGLVMKKLNNLSITPKKIIS
mgnify:CR=1 FL=1